MEWQLSDRLKGISDYIPSHRVVADIGADHGYLLIDVAKRGKLKKGIIGELNRGPLEAARKNVCMHGFSDQIELRLGDGLSILKPNEAEVIVIAGMGGALISQILEEGKSRLGRVERLVLQPNIGEYRVRQWLRENRFVIVEEKIVNDQNIFYEVIVAEPARGKDELLTDDYWDDIGPKLWENRDPHFYNKRVMEQEKRKRVLAQLAFAKTPEARVKKEVLKKEIAKWERVLTKWNSQETN